VVLRVLRLLAIGPPIIIHLFAQIIALMKFGMVGEHPKGIYLF